MRQIKQRNLRKMVDFGDEWEYTGTYNGGWNMPELTLRDYFAARALPIALNLHLSERELSKVFGKRTNITNEEIAATYAYRLADAMIKARGDYSSTD